MQVSWTPPLSDQVYIDIHTYEHTLHILETFSFMGSSEHTDPLS